MFQTVYLCISVAAVSVHGGLSRAAVNVKYCLPWLFVHTERKRQSLHTNLTLSYTPRPNSQLFLVSSLTDYFLTRFLPLYTYVLYHIVCLGAPPRRITTGPPAVHAGAPNQIRASRLVPMPRWVSLNHGVVAKRDIRPRLPKSVKCSLP